ncbi:MAG: sugar nucleotide-binding protein [Brachybacterium sp.]|uniref:sugar nucleotide-binding protein n=1 Tax=Brachybacterium sp. AOP35-5H-19 TaxID=3457685 RepID=UPI003FB81AF2
MPDLEAATSQEREGTEPGVRTTPIPGLLVIDLPCHQDERGWLKENWQRQKMVARGLPDFHPVQNTICHNDVVGAMRGFHAEPWDKYVSVGSGRMFGAWIDLRDGPTFGTTYWHEISPEVAVFVPRGVANAVQTVVAPATYTYLTTGHWCEDATAGYSYVSPCDESLQIPWPIRPADAVLSARDLAHPALSEVRPVRTARTLVLGGSGLLGRALADRWSDRHDVDVAARADLDLTDPSALEGSVLEPYDVIINAAAYTAADAAESAEGRREAWAVNVEGTGRLVEAARQRRATLVHVSSDYVFDGTREAYAETDAVSPLGVYGQTKAAADALVSTLPEHYIIRTSWVLGEGRDFVRTLLDLASRGIDPLVVDDQTGRLTSADDLAAAIDHLVTHRPPSGTYNVTSSGSPLSRATIADEVFRAAGLDPLRITPVSTEEYYAARSRAEGDGTIAPRPRSSVLDLAKIRATGFVPQDQLEMLRAYVARAWPDHPSAPGRP